MSRHVRQLLTAAVVATAVTGVLAPPAGGQDLDAVTEQREQLESEVSAAMAALEELEARRAAAETELATLDQRRDQLRDQAAETRDELELRVREHFKRGGTSVMSALLAGDGPTDALERSALLSTLHRRDDATIEAATAQSTRLEQLETLLASRNADLEQVETELRDRTEDLQARLDATARRETALKARAARQQQISRGSQQGTYSCIFDPGNYHFIDSWGFPRSGGRSHQGADVMAPRGVNVYAFTSGTIGRLTSGGLGGISLRIRGDDGNRYYYAHMQGFADGIRPGVRVEAGQLVGFNGSSGNARGGATHVHFQLHAGGGAPINPYPWLRAVCP